MKKIGVVLAVIAFCLLTSISVSAVGNQPPHGGDCFYAISGPFSPDRSIDELYESIHFSPVKHQVFPEGCLEFGFETWILVYNSSEATARYSVVISGKNGYIIALPNEIKPHQRKTFDISQIEQIRPGELGYPLNVSIDVYADSQKVYAQESMYWNDRAGGNTTTGF